MKAIAIDKLDEACDLTIQNAELCGILDRIQVLKNDLTEFNFDIINAKKFDLIVSNPPYILSEDMKTLQPEIYL